MGLDDLEHVVVRSRAELRAWLSANAATSPSIWLVTPPKSSDTPPPSYDDIVEEALCFGWIDATVRRRDDGSLMRLLAPRKPTSMWSATNKARLEHLLADGLMTEGGLRAIEVARANGSWELLDQVERLEVPSDLAAALDSAPGARAFFDAMPPSARKQHLWFVISAKRPATRATRVAEVATSAAEGRRAV